MVRDGIENDFENKNVLGALLMILIRYKTLGFILHKTLLLVY